MPEKRTFGQKMRDAAGWVFHTPDSDEEDGAAGVPARPSRPPSLSPMEAELAESDFYEDDIVIAPPAPANHFERYRALIDSFDEDRESGLEKVVRWFFLGLSYLLPLIVACAMGREIGAAYGGAFNLADAWSFGTHTL